MAVSDAQIISIISLGTFPYKILFREGKQPNPVYPSVEVRTVRARSRTTDPEVKTEEQEFEIRVKLKYIRTIEQEAANLQTIESLILSNLESANVEAGQFFFENKQWHQETRQHPHGVDSVLNFTFRDLFPKTPGTVIGAGSTIQIGNTTVALIRQGSGAVGRDSTDAYEDDGSRYPIKGKRVGTRFFEYKVTQADYDSIETMCDLGNYQTAILNENGISHTYTVLPVIQRDTSSYTGLKTAIIQVEIQH